MPLPVFEINSLACSVCKEMFRRGTFVKIRYVTSLQTIQKNFKPLLHLYNDAIKVNQRINLKLASSSLPIIVMMSRHFVFCHNQIIPPQSESSRVLSK